jgi:hypothetical protein
VAAADAKYCGSLSNQATAAADLHAAQTGAPAVQAWRYVCQASDQLAKACHWAWLEAPQQRPLSMAGHGCGQGCSLRVRVVAMIARLQDVVDVDSLDCGARTSNEE